MPRGGNRCCSGGVTGQGTGVRVAFNTIRSTNLQVSFQALIREGLYYKHGACLNIVCEDLTALTWDTAPETACVGFK